MKQTQTNKSTDLGDILSGYLNKEVTTTFLLHWHCKLRDKSIWFATISSLPTQEMCVRIPITVIHAECTFHMTEPNKLCNLSKSLSHQRNVISNEIAVTWLHTLINNDNLSALNNTQPNPSTINKPSCNSHNTVLLFTQCEVYDHQ